MGKLLLVILSGVTLAFLAERIVRLGRRINFAHETLKPVDLPNCHLIDGIETGAEDIDILPYGLAFISSGLKFPGMTSFAPDQPGKIFLMDLNEESPVATELRISPGFDVDSFNPHGISTYIDQNDGTVYLFVVNHPQFKSTVELFRFVEEENVLEHLKTIHHDLLPRVNDIVALGLDSFYATNDHYFSGEFMGILEQVLDLSWSNIIYYSPQEVKEVATGFHSANGISISTDRNYVYVSDALGHSIHVMEKHADWSLSQVKVLEFDNLLDNLFVDPIKGDVWAGCHPKGWKLLFYSPDDPPESEVIRVQNILSENPIVTQVYANNGSVLQGSSVACVYDRKLLVGTVFHRALYCELEKP
uniref:Paraoxonase n=1 Tax=Geotrypetes seraphini TaxID=260995 RepID=A0A6P8QJT3_GEOSA|nr:serum paraoxonase/arylesterase 2-like [Geotrypetes seraphini]